MGELPKDAHPARYYDWAKVYQQKFKTNNFIGQFF